jgi:transposase
MEVMIQRGAGIDVHKSLLVVCVLIFTGNKSKKLKKRFGTFKADLIELRDWLVSEGCTHVVMESTSVYWMPVYEILEGHVEIVVGNAQHIKNVPGRKTDENDAEWLAKLLCFGLIRNSFVPPKPIRHLRQLSRFQNNVTKTATQQKHRIHGVLETGNIKLGSVASDIFGASGTDMLHALVKGKLQPADMAQFARRKMKAKIPQLTLALDGTMTDHHRNLLRMELSMHDKIDASLAEVELAMIEAASPYNELLERLDMIPGVNQLAAIGVIAEIGVDMSVWHSDGHLTAWAGLCPGSHESAGKRRKVGVRKGNPHLKRLMIQIATSAVKTNGTYYQHKYQQLAKRRGHKRAIVAIARKILTTIFHMISRGTDYTEVGLPVSRPVNREQEANRFVSKLQQLGFNVSLSLAANG